jgi:hypothetical protein
MALEIALVAVACPTCLTQRTQSFWRHHWLCSSSSNSCRRPCDLPCSSTTWSKSRKSSQTAVIRNALLNSSCFPNSHTFFRSIQKQLAYMLGRQQICLELDDTEVGDSEELTEIMSNNHLNHHFLNLAREVIFQSRFSICSEQFKF